jgi:general secretion pathway protein K
MMRSLDNNRGMALILTILIISLVVALTIQLNAAMRADAYGAANVRDGMRLGYVAKSGFNYAMAVLQADAQADAEEEGQGDAFTEDWHLAESYGAASASLFSNSRFDVKISDHSGRIQINNLVNVEEEDKGKGKGKDKPKYNTNQIALLTRFLKSPEFDLDDDIAGDLVAAIVDYIDDDEDTYDVGGIGAEKDEYIKLGYAIRNGPIEFLEELLIVLKVKGLGEELFFGTGESPGISKYLTPYGEGKININTAERLVLQALSEDIDSKMLDEMDDYRRDEVNDLSEVNWGERTGTGESPPEDVLDLLDVKSTHFEITSDGFDNTSDELERTPRGIEGAMAKTVTGMVERTEESTRVLWQKIE